MKKPKLWLYLLGLLLQAFVLSVVLGTLASLSHLPLWLDWLVGFVFGVLNGSLWVGIYQRRMRRFFSQPWEFDCPDCGRHIVRFNRIDPRKKCAECLAIPGWWRDPHLVRLFDPLLVGREEEVEPPAGSGRKTGDGSWPK